MSKTHDGLNPEPDWKTMYQEASQLAEERATTIEFMGKIHETSLREIDVINRRVRTKDELIDSLAKAVLRLVDKLFDGKIGS